MALTDLLFGPQTQSVPQPQVSISDILTGGGDASNTSPTVATAYPDSPAPGAIAASAQQAESAGQGSNPFGSAVDWVHANPIKAQALMQGFAALARGGYGNLIGQLGQAAGVANQTMIEQTAANNDLARKNQQQQFENGLKTSQNDRQNADSASVIARRSKENQVSDQQIAASKESVATSEQNRGFKKQSFGTELEVLQAKLAAAKQDIANAKTQNQLTAARINAQNIENEINAKFGSKIAQGKVNLNEAQVNETQARGEEATARAVEANVKADVAAKTSDAIDNLSPEDQTRYYLGQKPKALKTVSEIATELYKSDPMSYQDKQGKMDTQRLMADAKALHGAQSADTGVSNPMAAPTLTPEVKAQWDKARNSVKVGERYKGPDGQTYVRKN